MQGPTEAAGTEKHPDTNWNSIDWHQQERRVCLSMISGTNFESEWGQLFPIRLTMISRFGGHLTMKKGNQLAFANEKGSHLLSAVFIRLRMLQLAPPPLPIVLLA